jgi:molybdate transport repressor ModE-like protein
MLKHLDDLTLLLRVADLGSISAAARSLDLSVAVASQRLQRLEKSLGVRLLHRTTRRLRLTGEGATLVERGRPLVQDLEAIAGSLQEAAGEVSGTLSVTVPASFGRQYISPLLPEFIQRHPRLKLHIDLSDQTRDLVREGFDLAIRIGELHDSTLVARRITRSQRVLCASPAYLKRRGVPRSPADLMEHDCLPLSQVGSQGLWRLRDPSGKEVSVRVRGPLESNLGEVLRDAALAGLGIALHSTWHVCEDLRAGRLQLVLPRYSLPESGIYAVMPQRRLVLPRARAFADFLAGRFGEPPVWERHARGRKG